MNEIGTKELGNRNSCAAILLRGEFY